MDDIYATLPASFVLIVKSPCAAEAYVGGKKTCKLDERYYRKHNMKYVLFNTLN